MPAVPAVEVGGCAVLLVAPELAPFPMLAFWSTNRSAAARPDAVAPPAVEPAVPVAPGV
jgi:hypothetical protein